IKSIREVPTLLLMRLAFGSGLCRFGMFRALKANSILLSTENTQAEVVKM
ncbi:MAG: SAM-dependent methyltransferase, partial [Okeania sp. SIO3B3]|nr:SAM-dependent methyltransferase [Okeania sp. SIO3B3]